MASRHFRRSTSLLLLSICSLALASVPAVACSEPGGTATGGAGGSAGEGGTGGSAGAGGTSGMGGTSGSGGEVPLVINACETSGISISCDSSAEGVELCEDGTDNCALTDGSGAAAIMLPANREVAYTMTKEGHNSYLVWDVTDETFLGSSSGWAMLTESQMEDIAEHLMIAYPWQGAVLALGAIPFRPGVTYELIGETATSYYNDEDGVAQLALTETTSDGRGGFVELSPGEYEVEFGGAVANCTPSIAPSSDTLNRITVTVREAHVTYASMNCAEP